MGSFQYGRSPHLVWHSPASKVVPARVRPCLPFKGTPKTVDRAHSNFAKRNERGGLTLLVLTLSSAPDQIGGVIVVNKKRHVKESSNAVLLATARLRKLDAVRRHGCTLSCCEELPTWHGTGLKAAQRSFVSVGRRLSARGRKGSEPRHLIKMAKGFKRRPHFAKCLIVAAFVGMALERSLKELPLAHQKG